MIIVTIRLNIELFMRKLKLKIKGMQLFYIYLPLVNQAIEFRREIDCQEIFSANSANTMMGENTAEKYPAGKIGNALQTKLQLENRKPR